MPCAFIGSGILKSYEVYTLEKLIEVKNTIAVLQKYGFNFSKKFGQNFLIDEHVLDKIIAVSELSKEDNVLEIGPGIGTMTQALSENAGHVYSVEIDDKLIPILKDTLSDCDNVTIINQDIMKVDIEALVRENCQGQPVKVVANLPYYITTPIIMNLLERRLPLKSITVMVQKEVAERMQAEPGTKDYGALSLAVRYYCEPYLAANVPPNCFMPRPDVSSAVIHLKRHEEPPVKVKDEKLMFSLIKASFAQRRKTLVNGVKNSAELDFTREQVEEALLKMQKSLSVRGETFGLQEFAELSDILGETR